MTRHASTHPFVATDLSVILPPDHADLSTDLLADGRVYRALDPDYYLWLRHKMELAKAKYSRGRLPAGTFDALRSRFNPLHDQAIALFGMDRLLDAARRFDPKDYRWPGLDAPVELAATEIPEVIGEPVQPDQVLVPPADRCSSEPTTPPSIPTPAADTDPWADHEYPASDGSGDALPHFHAIRQSALDKVRRIEQIALAAGWTHAELYANRGKLAFPYGDAYGLVCFVHPDQSIGAITPRAAEIVCRAGHSLHFYRKGALP